MRKFFLTIALLVGMNAFAGEGLESVMNTSVKMESQNETDSVAKRNSHLSVHLGFGVSIPVNVDDDISLVTMKSWESMVGITYDYTPKGALQTYSVGLGGIFRNYGTGSKNYFGKTDDGYVGMAHFPDGTKKRGSHIHTYSLAVPLMFTQKFGQKSHFGISLGAVLNLNTGDINSHYTIGDNDYSITTHHIGVRPFTVDFIGIFRFYGFGLYCKYSPMSVLKTDRGPRFQSVSVGLCF